MKAISKIVMFFIHKLWGAPIGTIHGFILDKLVDWEIWYEKIYIMPEIWIDLKNDEND